jgi:hypothetical protein
MKVPPGLNSIRELGKEGLRWPRLPARARGQPAAGRVLRHALVASGERNYVSGRLPAETWEITREGMANAVSAVGSPTSGQNRQSYVPRFTWFVG